MSRLPSSLPYYCPAGRAQVAQIVVQLVVSTGIGLVGITAAVAAQPNAEDEKTLHTAGIVADAGGLTKYLRSLSPLDSNLEQIDDWVRKLGSKQFREREEAQSQLVKVGHRAMPALQVAMQGSGESSRRAKQCLRHIQGFWDPQRHATAAAAIRSLAKLAPDDAEETLLRLLPAVDNNVELGDATWALLYELTVRRGKVTTVIEASVGDPAPARRAVAALLLGRKGTSEQCKIARMMLADSDATVRLRAAQGLLAGGDKMAVATLIELSGADPLVVALQADELLRWVAGDATPDFEPFGLNRPSEQHTAWQKWWAHAGAKADLPTVAKEPRRPGLFLIGPNPLPRMSQRFGFSQVVGCDGVPRWGDRRAKEILEIMPDGDLIVSGPSPSSLVFVPFLGWRQNGALRDAIMQIDFKGSIRWHQELAETSTFLFARYLPDGRVCFAEQWGKGFLSNSGEIQSYENWEKLDLKEETIAKIRSPFEGASECSLPNEHILRADGNRSRIVESDPIRGVVAEIPAWNGKFCFKVILRRLRLGFDDLPGRTVDLATNLEWRIAELHSVNPRQRSMAIQAIRNDFGATARAAVPALFNALGDNLTKPNVGIISYERRDIVDAILQLSSDPIADAIERTECAEPKLRAASLWLIGLPQWKNHDETKRWAAVKKCVHDGSPLVRKYALCAAGLFRSRADEMVPILVSALSDDKIAVPGEGCVGTEAAMSLIPYAAKAQAAIPMLDKAARSTDLFHARFAINCLTCISADRSSLNDVVSRLCSILKDPNISWESRACAAQGIAGIGPKAEGAIPDLIAVLGGKERLAASLKDSIIGALGVMGAKARSAVPAIMAALEDPDPMVRNSAATALKKIGQ